MPTIEFDKVVDVKDFSPLPAGRYMAELTNAEPTTPTQNGDERWKLMFTVAEGPHKGRVFYDYLVFSQAALGRVKFICRKLGITVKGAVELKPEMLDGAGAWVTVGVETYQDSEGRTKHRNVVPFTGYEGIDQA